MNYNKNWIQETLKDEFFRAGLVVLGLNGLLFISLKVLQII